MRQITRREKVGVWVLDVPRYLGNILIPGRWIRVVNRFDQPRLAPGGRGVDFPDRWGINLHAVTVAPWLGALLMRKAFSQAPVRFSNAPPKGRHPDISFIVPFRGKERISILSTTLASVFVQSGADVECIVVEQDVSRQLTEPPAGVRYLFLQNPPGTVDWRKSWAFNVGTEAARGRILVFHDADIPVPVSYAAELRDCFSEGYESVQIQRFLFYLGETDTRRIIADRELKGFIVPENVRQNWHGGTIAVTRDTFFRMGGFDERFTGWGGEDDEFFDRCRSLNHYGFGHLPFIHLWHPPQAAKITGGREHNLAMLAERLNIPPQERIRELAESLSKRRSENQKSAATIDS